MRFLFAALWIYSFFLPSAFSQPTRTIGLVVAKGPQDIQVFCLKTGLRSITGITLLKELSREHEFELQLHETGAVCGIDSVGCDTRACFCQCKGSTCQHWAFFNKVNHQDAFSLSSQGPSTTFLNDGDWNAWVWGHDPKAALTLLQTKKEMWVCPDKKP